MITQRSIRASLAFEPCEIGKRRADQGAARGAPFFKRSSGVMPQGPS
jgi:hypothetical protein